MPESFFGRGSRKGIGTMVPFHAEIRSTSGTRHVDTEGSIDTPLHVWFLEHFWIGWS